MKIVRIGFFVWSLLLLQILASTENGLEIVVPIELGEVCQSSSLLQASRDVRRTELPRVHQHSSKQQHRRKANLQTAQSVDTGSTPIDWEWALPTWGGDLPFAIFAIVLAIFFVAASGMLCFGSAFLDRERYLEESFELPENTVEMKEFKLEQNVFGSFTITCAKKLEDIDKMHAFWALTLVACALFVQASFSCVMIPYIATDIYKNKYSISPMGGFDNLFTEWRAHPHGPHFNATSQEMAAWACRGQLWTWEESMISNYVNYNTYIKLLGRPTFITKGQMFGVIAMFLWAAEVLTAIRSWATYVMLLFPSLHHNSKAFKLSPFLRLATCFISICRLIVLGNMCHSGLKFLAFTDNLKDFILNSVALGFVIDIHDILYVAFASNVEKEHLDKFEEKGKMRAKVPRLIWNHSGQIGVAMGFLMVILGLYYLWTFSLHLNYDVYQELCKGVMPTTQLNQTRSSARPLWGKWT